MPPERDDPNHTTVLLQRVRENDATALNELLTHVMPRIERWVRQKRGPAVGGRFDTMDCTQDVALGLVQYLPTVVVRDSNTFHGLLYRMIVNSLRNKHDYLMARRRRLTRERPLATEASVDLDPPAHTESPSEAAIRGEKQAWIRFALALLAAKDQELVFRHHYDGESFADIGRSLDQSADAVRMRFNRAMTRLATITGRLRSGQAAALAAELSEDEETSTAG